MARPYSSGLQYFPLDCGFLRDEKMHEMRAEFGSKGVDAYLGLLCVIYETQGYYTPWDKKTAKIYADQRGFDPGFVWEWALGCVKCGLFDERVFNVFQVLTSRGIQRRYLQCKRGSDRIYLYEELLIVDLSDTEDVPAGVRGKICLKKSFRGENHSFHGENPCFHGENPIKEKKSKVNISSYEDISAGKPADAPAQHKKSAARFRAPSLEEVQDYCAERRNGIDARRFIDYYESIGWKVGKNPMKDWKAAIRGWERNGVSNVKNAEAPPPSYDLDAIMRSAVDFDPAKTKRGEV